jgi:hypothetical protein
MWIFHYLALSIRLAEMEDDLAVDYVSQPASQHYPHLSILSGFDLRLLPEAS